MKKKQRFGRYEILMLAGTFIIVVCNVLNVIKNFLGG